MAGQCSQARGQWRYRVAPAEDNAKWGRGGDAFSMSSDNDIKKGSGMKYQAFNSVMAGAVLWGLAACSPNGRAQSEPAWTPQALVDSQWIDAGPVVGQAPVSLDIAKDARLSGHAGCNRYLGKVEISGNAMRLVNSGSTRMLCFPQEVMDTENRFLQALEQTRSAKKEQGLLLLLDEAGQVLWRFKPRD